MDLLTPDWGLVFWTTVSFGILFFILASKAWKPILNIVNEREREIEKALISAEAAKKEMELLAADNERILREARQKKEQILKEAREIKREIIQESKDVGKKEAEKIILQAREIIKNERMAAITELKNQVGALSLEIAEKLLKDELSDKDKHSILVMKLLKDIKVN